MKRVYFMEELYGERGNLMPRDIVSKCNYDAPSQVYLDLSFLGEELIRSRLSEVAEVCHTYAGIDILRESILFLFDVSGISKICFLTEKH